MPPTTSRKRTYFGVLVSVALWAIVIFGFLQRQAIYDWWQLRDYDPPTQVAQLATDTTMNDKTRRVFYVYHPQIEPKENFNAHCRDGEYTIVLGCYISNKGIFIYEVTDERLQGVEQVTAAHELLHAAYDRLSVGERRQVDAWLKTAFDGLTNQRLKDTLAQYQNNDPASVPSELHSILGTELRDLSPELENYYSRYFMDRSKIVDYSDSYENAFSSRQAQAKVFEAQLESMEAEIAITNKQLDAENQSLKNQYQSLESQRSSADPVQFNAAVDDYNQAVKDYNVKVAQVTAKIDRYNALYAEYEKVVLEQQDLFGAIDSRPKALQTE